MKRKIDAVLDAWKAGGHRKPMALLGARQTGKTTSVLAFGERAFKNTLHVDFIRRPDLKEAFARSLEPDVVVANLCAMLRTSAASDETLLFFDEVQECDQAETALKYFCTDAPEWHVVAAGSLLGVRVARKASFPVGYVDMRTLHPLDFEEFCWAVGDTAAFDLAKRSFSTLDRCAAHDMLLERYREYLLVGGMPEPVARHAEGMSLEEVRTKQREIVDAYVADMAKYAENVDAAKIVACWNSVPNQLAKASESTRFIWKEVASSARSSRYGTAIDWLRAANLVNVCTQVTDGESPLKSFENPKSFKVYLADTGLLSCLYDATPQDLQDKGPRTARFRGGLAENYVMQQLMAADMRPYYWGMESKGEVEFVVKTADGVVPVEVKSGKNTAAASVRAFAQKYGCPYIVKVSAKNFGEENGVKSVPLYAAGLIGRL